jgi:hypothetical protein
LRFVTSRVIASRAMIVPSPSRSAQADDLELERAARPLEHAPAQIGEGGPMLGGDDLIDRLPAQQLDALGLDHGEPRGIHVEKRAFLIHQLDALGLGFDDRAQPRLALAQRQLDAPPVRDVEREADDAADGAARLPQRLDARAEGPAADGDLVGRGLTTEGGTVSGDGAGSVRRVVERRPDSQPLTAGRPASQQGETAASAGRDPELRVRRPQQDRQLIHEAPELVRIECAESGEAGNGDVRHTATLACRSSGVQHIADLAREAVGRERFLEKRAPRR